MLRPVETDGAAPPSIAERTNPALYNWVQFAGSDCPNVVVGDSRFDRLDSDALAEMSGRCWFNLGLGGASVREVASLVRLTVERDHVKRLVVGLGPSQLHSLGRTNRVEGAHSLVESPVLYFTHPDVVEAAFDIMADALGSVAPPLGRPDVSPEEFWRFQLTETAADIVRHRTAAPAGLGELAVAVQRARERGVEVVFVLPPIHTDLQQALSRGAQAALKPLLVSWLSRLGLTLDFAIDTPTTRDRSRFDDPFHPDSDFDAVWTSVVWGDRAPEGLAVIYGNRPAGPAFGLRWEVPISAAGPQTWR